MDGVSTLVHVGGRLNFLSRLPLVGLGSTAAAERNPVCILLEKGCRPRPATGLQPMLLSDCKETNYERPSA